MREQSVDANFHGYVNGYTIELKYTRNDGELEITATNEDTIEKYGKNIDKGFIDFPIHSLNNTFASVKQLYIFLQQHHENIIIRDGVFSLQYGKKKVEIKLDKKKQGEIVKQQINNLQRELQQLKRKSITWKHISIVAMLCILCSVGISYLACSWYQSIDQKAIISSTTSGEQVHNLQFLAQKYQTFLQKKERQQKYLKLIMKNLKQRGLGGKQKKLINSKIKKIKNSISQNQIDSILLIRQQSQKHQQLQLTINNIVNETEKLAQSLKKVEQDVNLQANQMKQQAIINQKISDLIKAVEKLTKQQRQKQLELELNQKILTHTQQVKNFETKLLEIIKKLKQQLNSKMKQTALSLIQDQKKYQIKIDKIQSKYQLLESSVNERIKKDLSQKRILEERKRMQNDAVTKYIDKKIEEMKNQVQQTYKMQKSFNGIFDYSNSSYSRKQQEYFYGVLEKKIAIISHIPKNIYKSSYLITPVSLTSARLKKISEKYSHFVDEYQIQPNKEISYSAKIIRKRSASMLFGFTTQKDIQIQNLQRSHESVFYNIKNNGILWIGGSRKSLVSLGAKEGDTIDSVIDFATGKISWWKNGNKIQEIDIPVSMKGKPIYFSFFSFWTGDELEISVIKDHMLLYFQQLEQKNRQIKNNMSIISVSLNELKQINAKLIFEHQSFIGFNSHHPNNLHQLHYLINSSSMFSAKLRKMSTGSYCFINNIQVPPSNAFSYQTKILKIQGPLFIGFTTNDGLGKMQNYKQKESIYYNIFGNGQLWIGGSGKYLRSAGMSRGDTIESKLDRINGKFSFWKNGTKLFEGDIPESMKAKAIFISLIINREGDQVEMFMTNRYHPIFNYFEEKFNKMERRIQNIQKIN